MAKSILVVDDSPVVRRGIRRMLEVDEDFTVCGEAVDGRSTASDDTSRSDSNQHNYGWIGLIGLLGLAGLRRQKSPEHERVESAGVN